VTLTITLLDRLISSEKDPGSQPTVGRYLLKIAQLGGYLARASDPPPGNMVMWRGVSALPIFTWDFYWRKEMWVIERLSLTLTYVRRAGIDPRPCSKHRNVVS
jgi:hypothetical protein